MEVQRKVEISQEGEKSMQCWMYTVMRDFSCSVGRSAGGSYFESSHFHKEGKFSICPVTVIQPPPCETQHSLLSN